MNVSDFFGRRVDENVGHQMDIGHIFSETGTPSKHMSSSRSRTRWAPSRFDAIFCDGLLFV